MQDLIERLQKALGPDRDIDCAIFDLVKAWPKVDGKPGWRHTPAGTEATVLHFAAHYTASIDAALTLVPDGWSWSSSGPDYNSETGRRDSYFGYVREHQEIPKEVADDPAATWRPDAEGDARHTVRAIALCVAALKARSTIVRRE